MILLDWHLSILKPVDTQLDVFQLIFMGSAISLDRCLGIIRYWLYPITSVKTESVVVVTGTLDRLKLWIIQSFNLFLSVEHHHCQGFVSCRYYQFIHCHLAQSCWGYSVKHHPYYSRTHPVLELAMLMTHATLHVTYRRISWRSKQLPCYWPRSNRKDPLRIQMHRTGEI